MFKQVLLNDSVRTYKMEVGEGEKEREREDKTTEYCVSEYERMSKRGKEREKVGVYQRDRTSESMKVTSAQRESTLVLVCHMIIFFFFFRRIKRLRSTSISFYERNILSSRLLGSSRIHR